MEFDETKQISMDELLDALLDDDHNQIDAHLRPQYKVLCSSAITPHKIFYMEQMKDLILFLDVMSRCFSRYQNKTVSATPWMFVRLFMARFHRPNTFI